MQMNEQTETKRDPAREFLCTVKEARFNTQRCLCRIKEAEAECGRITAQCSGLPGGGGDLHKDGPWAALADLRSLLLDNYREALRQEIEVEKFIALLRKDSHRIILRLRYVDCLRWPGVLKELEKKDLYYSERQVYRLHGEALHEARLLWAELHPGEGMEG